MNALELRGIGGDPDRPRYYLGFCHCCGAVVRASRMIDTDECADCLAWRLAVGGAA